MNCCKSEVVHDARILIAAIRNPETKALADPIRFLTPIAECLLSKLDREGRLLNAAPALLAALKGMCGLAAKLLKQGEGCMYNPEGNGYMQSARAAIAQAEGGGA